MRGWGVSYMFLGVFILVFCPKNQVSYQVLKIKGQLKKLTCTFFVPQFPPKGKRNVKNFQIDLIFVGKQN